MVLRDECEGNDGHYSPDVLSHSLHCFLQQTNHSKTTLFSMYPNPSIATRTTSPSFRYTYGLRTKPTPSGVPVKMIVPFFSVVPSDKKETISGTPQIMSDVFEFCITLSFSFVDSCSLFAIASASDWKTAHPLSCGPNTICGPIGLNVSNDFARVHCPPLFLFPCQRRADTSLPMQ